MSDPTPVIDDLREESEELDALVAELSPEGWRRATPAPGWTIAHQIAHLNWTDRAALAAVTDEDGFRALVEQALAAPDRYVDDGAEEGRSRTPPHCSRPGGRAAPPSPRRCAPPPPAPVSPGTARPWPPPPWPPHA